MPQGAIARGFSTVYVNVEVEGYVAVPQCSLSDADWLFRFFHVLVCIICYSCYFFLWSNKVTTKISELKRKDLENAKIFVSVYSADIRVSFSFSLRIVSGFFPCGFSTSLSDAKYFFNAYLYSCKCLIYNILQSFIEGHKFVRGDKLGTAFLQRN